MTKHQKNILQDLVSNVEKFPNETCFLVKDQKAGVWGKLTWREVFVSVANVASRLSKLGIKKGDSVAIYSNTRAEWTIIDLAILSIGAVTVPIYQNLNKDHVNYIINHSNASCVFVEDYELIQNLDSYSQDKCQIVLIDENLNGAKTSFYKEFANHNNGYSLAEYKSLIENLNHDDIASCVYTSGTTGDPKGVLLTHANILGEAMGLSDAVKFQPNEIGLLFLPLAHVMARAMQFYQIKQRFICAYAESIAKVSANMLEISPHFIMSVPRMLEKIFEQVVKTVAESSKLKQHLFKHGLEVGKNISNRAQMNNQISALNKLKAFAVKGVVFRNFKKKMGGRLKYVISGGAPLDKDLAKIFNAMGLLILEGYGLTETFAAVTINRPNDYKFGTVGKALKDVQISIGDDGEILLKGPQVFNKYKEPVLNESTKDQFVNGWFKSGDIGEFSKEGFLKITGRKKELIVTASGKNIVPQRVENVMRSSKFINDIIVYGDRKKYLSALITLNFEQVKAYILNRGVSFVTSDDLARLSDTYELIKSEIDSRNRQLARHETIKRFSIISHEFSTVTGELTPTLKIRRNKIYERYRSIIEQMYE